MRALTRASRPPGLAVTLALLAVVSGLAVIAPDDDPVHLDSPALASAGRPRVTFLDDAPDPHVIRTGDRYYAYATNGTRFGSGQLINVPRFESANLAGWSRTAQADALPVRPTWAYQSGGWMWAPTVFRADNGQYVMFFTARSVAVNRQCIGRAVSNTPNGTFVPTGGGPVLCQWGEGGSIDPYHFRNPIDGRRYLYWKNDGNACQPNCAVRLWGMPMDGNGNLTGSATPLLNHDRFWEIPLIENPAMTYSPVGNVFRLFYSANWYTSANYSTGYGHCAGPLGPCWKRTLGGPWHNSTPYAKGPGGAAFFEDFDGKNWMAYHGYQPGHIGQGHARFLFIDKVDFHQTPNLNTTIPYGFHRNQPFVDATLWAATAIAWLGDDTAPFPGAARGAVATGYFLDPDEVFRPTWAITRAQLLNWVWKLAGHPGETPPPSYPPSPFSDTQPWVRLAMDWVGSQGIMTGYPDNSTPPACGGPGPAPVFRGSCPISRGEYVRLVWRAQGSPRGYPNPGFSDVPPTSWIFDAVSWAYGEGHMTGYPDRTFRGGLPIRRDQVANAFYSIYGP